MARTLTPKDAHALMNSLVAQATGEASLTVTNSSDFVSAGELVLATGTENVLNALGIVMGRTLVAVRPYRAKLNIINALNTGEFTSRLRKISFYQKPAQAAGDWNTDLYTNFAEGYDNGSNGGASTGTMWEQSLPIPLEMNFGGQSVWDECITVLENQIKIALRDEDEFLRFVSGFMTQKANDIEKTKEAFNRMTLLNKMASVYDMSSVMPGSVVDLIAGFNAEKGTTYTRAVVLQSHLQEFLQYFTATFKIYSDLMTHDSIKFHWSPTKTVGGTSYVLPRHTPKDRQRAILYAPFFIRSKAEVFSEIFNPEYLEDGAQHELVDYWQSIDSPTSISVTPAVTDTAAGATYGTQIVGSNVALDYVLGCLYDVDSVMTDYQFEGANATPIEARHRYHNLYWHFSKNSLSDPTENFVLFYLGAGGP